MAKIFNILFIALIVGFISLFTGQRFIQLTFIAPLGFILVLLLSPIVLILSIYQLRKNRKNWIIPILAIILSIFGILISIGLLIALKNFT
ncbi:MAG: hypothetical protein Q7S27_02670 [Nanoarchaeota archaeon]|nr:hypothetical protein [Nanoarchaeota archaeon]